MVTILTLSTKMAILVLLKIKVFSNKSYNVIISIYDFSNKILSRESHHITDENNIW